LTDVEISKALALAIGWDESTISIHFAGTHPSYRYILICPDGRNHFRTFNYLDWSVIGPIAAKYNKFPYVHRDKKGLLDGQWVVWPDTIADTPQKAIAMAVIGDQIEKN
jgi:hypothetical protein